MKLKAVVASINLRRSRRTAACGPGRIPYQLPQTSCHPALTCDRANAAVQSALAADINLERADDTSPGSF